MRRHHSISAISSGLTVGTLKRKRRSALRPAQTRFSRKLGTIFPTCWTSRAGQKPQSIVCAVRSEPPRIMSTRCSILRCCYSEATSTRRRRSTGGAISPRTASLNGQHGRVGPSNFCEMQMHLSASDWVRRAFQGSTRRPTLTARARAPIRELKQFQELVKRNCAELAYCEDIAISTKHFTFSKLPVFSTKVTERFKINPDPIGKDGGATRHQFSPTGETVTYTAQAAELWITDGRSLTPAAEVLEHAFQWWRKFFDEMSTS